MESIMTPDEPVLAYQPRTHLQLLSGGRVLTIPCHTITHLTKWGNRVFIYGGGEVYETHQSLGELLRELPVQDFFRVHRSHVISLAHLEETMPGRLKVGAHWVPCTTYYRQHMLRALRRHLNCAYQTLAYHGPAL